MLAHDLGMAEEFLDQQPTRNAASAEHTQHPQGAEEVQGASEISQQKTNRDQVEKYAEGARDSIMRRSALAVDVTNWDFNDRGSVPRRQRGDETVQFPVEWDLLQNLAPIRLEGCAEIVNAHSAQLGHQPVGTARRNAAQPEVVNAALAPSADNVVALGDLFQE